MITKLNSTQAMKTEKRDRYRLLPWPFRLVTWIVIATQLLLPFSNQLFAAETIIWPDQDKQVQPASDAFRCGPIALERIGKTKGASVAAFKKLATAQVTSQGMCLETLCDLANEAGFDYQMAKRQLGGEIPVPAVVHWKRGHYSALLQAEHGRCLIDDPTEGGRRWVDQSEIEQQASGYFLVMQGPLPQGWTIVSQGEGRLVWGKGPTETNNPDCFTPDDEKDCPKPGVVPMAQYSIHLMLVSLNIVDTPVGYSPPRGPSVFFRVTYNQRDYTQPTNYSNLGDKWTFEWLSYLIDDPTTASFAPSCYVQGGGVEQYTNYHAATLTFDPHADSHTILTRTSANSYERLFPDGSRQIFSMTNGAVAKPRKIFLTEIIDASSNTMSFHYDSTFRLTNVVDALGQITTLSYGSATPGNALYYKITQVTDPFGRYAAFQYDNVGRLTNITDILGINSGFTYGASNFITSLTTPYGTTTFTNGQSTNGGRTFWLEATDPLGQKERVEFIDNASSYGILPLTLPANLVPSLDAGKLLEYTGKNNGPYNSFLNYRTTYYWDKKAMALYPGDYTKAHLYHWLHDPNGITTCSGTLASMQPPLENRIWYIYAGQKNRYQEGTNRSPVCVARVLDDGSTQVSWFKYNAHGKVIQAVDPTNRTTVFTYSTNMIDLLQVGQMVGSVTQVLASFTYTNHLPLTSTDAAGNTNFFGYNNFGQLIGVTNALGQPMTLGYDVNGNLLGITGVVVGATTTFTYDGTNRVRTVTDSEGYTLTFDYDSADRVTKVTYPDNTYNQIVYDRLDPVLMKDRRGHWSTKFYDALRRVTDVVDAAGRRTHLEWCGCGGLESITDPLGRMTLWVRDLQGRPTAKVYADGTQTSYTYESTTSRLKSVTDAKNQSTLYSYWIDNNLKQLSYSNALVATPSVSFTYDTNYNRLLTMTDGIGTTTKSYYIITNGQLGAGMLANVDGPLSDDTIIYDYDALGRATNRAINGVAQTLTYDDLGRVTVLTNALGRFTNTYVNTTFRPDTTLYPNKMRTVYNYMDNAHDQRLQTIHNFSTNTTTNLSQFDYTYDADGEISTWTQQTNSAAPRVWSIDYDPADQVLGVAIHSNSLVGALVRQFVYGYDAAGNRISERINSGLSQSSYNNLNELTSRTNGGQMRFKGWLSETGTVQVAGVTATMQANTNFTGYASVTNGTNVVPLVASDYSGNSRTTNFTMLVTNNGVANTISYDLNGNQTSVVTATSTNTFEWDAADRLVAIVSGTNRSEFTYDGLGRRVQILEKQNGVGVQTNTFVWCGLELCEERDYTGTVVSNRYFWQGEIQNGTPYFYTRDHLGSVREMVAVMSATRAQYDYDPFGRRTKVINSKDSHFGFTGHYFHLVSGLYLAPYRAYDPDAGRWLSRDPIGEAGGLNLYAYVENNLIGAIDPLGLTAADVEKIIKLSKQHTKDLTKLKRRLDSDNGWINNSISTLQRLFKKVRRSSDEPYLGCGEQAESLADFLNKQETDDQWTFYYVTVRYWWGGIHQYVEAVSNNPTDPQLYLDSWANQFGDEGGLKGLDFGYKSGSSTSSQTGKP